MRKPSELVVDTDEAHQQRVAELAAIDRAIAELRLAVRAGPSEIDVAEFRARGPIAREHVLDAAMLDHDPLNYHPLENDRTTAISPADLLRLIAASGHVPRIVELSGLAREPKAGER